MLSLGHGNWTMLKGTGFSGRGYDRIWVALPGLAKKLVVVRNRASLRSRLLLMMCCVAVFLLATAIWSQSPLRSHEIAAAPSEPYRIGTWFFTLWNSASKGMQVKLSQKLYGRSDPWVGCGISPNVTGLSRSTIRRAASRSITPIACLSLDFTT